MEDCLFIYFIYSAQLIFQGLFLAFTFKNKKIPEIRGSVMSLEAKTGESNLSTSDYE